MYKKYSAEGIGTFALAFAVTAAVNSSVVLPVPVVAGLTLGLFVYTIGTISGCQINPAITIGLWSIGKMTARDTFFYVIAQVCGAALAVAAVGFLGVGTPTALPFVFNPTHFIAEALGAFFFAFGIAAVVYGQTKEQLSGVVVGGSLVLGILLAVFAGSAGILNPAVAFTLNAVSIAYIFGPIIGAAIGFQVYSKLTP